jgi:hypothetical protein
MVRHVEHSLKELRSKQNDEVIQSAILHVFRHLSETGELGDEVIIAHAALFDDWSQDAAPKLDKSAIVADGGKLFRLTAPIDPKEKDAAKPPSEAPKLWVEITE